MKKVISSLLALSVLVSMLLVPASAANSSPISSITTKLAFAAEEEKTLPPGIVVTKGIVSYEPTSIPDATTRATTVPTRLAPSSWYDVYHYWTAKKYTYTSYLFDPAYHSDYTWQYFYANTENQKFYVQVYDQKGDFLFEITSGTDYELEFGFDVNVAKPYYVVIYNNNPENGSISSGARYKVCGVN